MKEVEIQEKERNKEDQENAVKITVTREAAEAVATIVERVNDGFVGGKVNRQQMASLGIIKFSESLGQQELRAIRNEFLDEIALLEAYMKRTRETGKIPSELKKLVLQQMGVDDAPRKTAKSKLTDLYTNDLHEEVM